MAKIILIETSTTLCSAALAEDGKILSYKEDDGRRHAAMLAPLVESVLKEKSLTVKDCDAVGVSMGPGSYTGLRVGVSTAKGLCFGAGLPLIAIPSLDVLVWSAIESNPLPEGCKYIVPMIDARRMEVYSAVFNVKGEQISQTEAMIINADSFEKELLEGAVLFVGDGAGKCSGLIKSQNAHFLSICPDANGMCRPVFREYNEKRFKDIAYFEPFYLKNFVATVSKKKLF